jgi:hypothetical protein
MSTFSLVGSVIPTAAAGSLFAGFMSVANLAYAFGYGSGAWLYEHGMGIAPIRDLQASLFGLPGKAGDELSVNMLILINSLAYLLSFVCVHVLPDRRATQATEQDEEVHPGPERWHVLTPGLRRAIDAATIVAGLAFVALMISLWDLEPISACLIGFFGFTMLRKLTLDALLRRAGPATA